MPQRVSCLALVLSLCLAGIALAQRAPTTAARAAEEQRALLNQLAEAQKWVGEQIWSVKQGLDTVPGQLSELKDATAAGESDRQKLREEVKGLYVETSDLRQKLDELKGEIAGVNANVSAFRTFSGFFIAVMILLLAVIFIMSIRR